MQISIDTAHRYRRAFGAMAAEERLRVMAVLAAEMHNEIVKVEKQGESSE